MNADLSDGSEEDEDGEDVDDDDNDDDDDDEVDVGQNGLDDDEDDLMGQSNVGANRKGPARNGANGRKVATSHQIDSDSDF